MQPRSQALSSWDWERGWEECCLDELHIDEVYRNWFCCFENIVKKHIPSRTVEIRPKDKPWFTSEIRKAIRKRNRLLKKHWVKKTTFTWQRYKVQRNSTTSLIRNAKISYYQKLNIQLSDPMLSSKKWWPGSSSENIIYKYLLVHSTNSRRD